MNIAKQLIRGSQELNRIETETDLLVRMLLGILENKVSRRDSNFKQVITVGRAFYWEITWRKGKLRARCVHKHAVDYLAYSTDPEWSDDCAGRLGVSGVQDVHETLDKLVQRLRETFPSLDADLEPFLKAAG